VKQPVTVGENWRAKGVLGEETADTRSIVCPKLVTGQRSNQLNYVPTRQINEMRNNQCLCGFARFAYRAPVAPDCPKERDDAEVWFGSMGR
jgi:hypothetical protein